MERKKWRDGPATGGEIVGRVGKLQQGREEERERESYWNDGQAEDKRLGSMLKQWTGCGWEDPTGC